VISCEDQAFHQGETTSGGGCDRRINSRPGYPKGERLSYLLWPPGKYKDSQDLVRPGSDHVSRLKGPPDLVNLTWLVLNATYRLLVEVKVSHQNSRVGFA
jgi:hypothetical protein